MLSHKFSKTYKVRTAQDKKRMLKDIEKKVQSAVKKEIDQLVRSLTQARK